MNYHFLRLFLVEFERPPLLVEAGRVPPQTSREEYLSRVFSNRVDFLHRKSPFVYIPIGRTEFEGGAVCLGRLGRQTTEIVNKPPEQNFDEQLQTSWRAANVLIDTRSDSDGQRVAFQFRTDVGKPLSLFSSLVSQINEQNTDSGWTLEVNVMSKTESFWDAVRDHKGEITYAEFTFVTPNVLGIRNKLNDDLKKSKKNQNAHKVRVGFENKNGELDLSGQEIRDAVEYTSEGGGSSRLKSGKNIIYNSETQQRVIGVEEDEPLNSTKKSTWARLSDILFR